MKILIKNLIKKIRHAELDSASQTHPYPSLTKGGSRKAAFTLAEVFSPCRKVKLNFGFTLAETLITLGIIGIVAAMTLPSLIANYKEKQTITQFKYAVSLFSQGFTRMANDADGQLTNLFGPWNDFRHLNEDFYKQYFKITKMCIKYGSYKDCAPQQYYALNRQMPAGFFGTYVIVGKLSNGMIFGIGMPNGRSEGWQDRFVLHVDLNGEKGPNALGIDAFLFLMKNNGLLTYFNIEAASCDKFHGDFGGDGRRCSEWIMKKGNMDYLHRSIPNWSSEWIN